MSSTENEDTEIEDGASGPRARSKNVRPGDWIKIINLAKEGVPVERISAIFNVAKSTIYRKFKANNIRVGSVAETAEQVAADQARRALIEKIRDTKNDDFQLTNLVQRKAVKLIVDAEKAGKPLAALEGDMKTLNMAMKIVQNGTNNKWRILGLDRENDDADNELPELVVRELTEDEITAMRDRQSLDDMEGIEDDDENEDEELEDEVIEERIEE